jgi:hypothetical protein
MADWRNGGMAEWRNGGMAEWRNGGMAEWRNGGMAEWRNGEMAEWWNSGWKGKLRNCGHTYHIMVLTISQIDNILYNKHGDEQISCWETCCYLKEVSYKSHDPTEESQSLQYLSEEERRRKEKIPQHYSFGG